MITTINTHNYVTLKPEEGLVEKIYARDSEEERLLHFSNEKSALTEIPTLSDLCAVPRIHSFDLGKKEIKMEYLEDRLNLMDEIKQCSPSVYLDEIDTIMDFLSVIKSKTNHKYGVPEDLKSKLKSYSANYSSIINPEYTTPIQNLQNNLPIMPLARTHNDFRLANILLKKGEKPAIIDWEYYSYGSELYDSATLVVNTLLNLYSKNVLNENDKVINLLSSKIKTDTNFYINALTRTLVEFSPGIKREEYGSKERLLPFLNGLIGSCINNIYEPKPLTNFVSELKYNIGQK